MGKGKIFLMRMTNSTIVRKLFFRTFALRNGGVAQMVRA